MGNHLGHQFRGIMTALATPFLHGQVDYESLGRLVEWQVSQGVDGFVVHGTTGESPTVDGDERFKIYSFIRSRVGREFPLIVGTGTNSTAQTIQLSKEAETWGADGILVVVPYYNKPPQAGLLEHFKSVASSVSVPTLLYNVPGRTITSLSVETIQKLSQHPRIVGIKEASGDLAFAKEIRKACGDKFTLLSGDDGTADEFQKQGGQGVISVSSHLIPKAMKQLETSRYKEVVDLLFVEANPIPLKMALHWMKIFTSAEMRLPLVELSSDGQEKLKAAMTKAGLL